MTKSKKSMIVGAALAGLLAGGASVQASTLLHNVKNGMSTAQDQSGDQKSEQAKDPKLMQGQGRLQVVRQRLQGTELLQGQGRLPD